MRPTQLRDMTAEELAQKVQDLRQEYFHLRYRRTTAHLENVKRIRDVKKDIARCLTIIAEKKA